MVEILYKKYVALEEGQLLGAFIFYKDSEGRPCFKFSISPKIYSGDLWVRERISGRTRSFLKNKVGKISYDASYKFADHLLELKTQEPGKKPQSLMTEVPTPPQNYLFMVRIKNWRDLPLIDDKKDALLLTPPWSCNEIVIFFSFSGNEGKPFMPEPEYMKKIEGKTILIELPSDEEYYKKL
jgi:hypothetical protein